MSGAQWSPARLINLADILEEPHMDPRVDGFANRAADALRDFASVVSVLERVDRRNDLHVEMWMTDGYHAWLGGADWLEEGVPLRNGDTPLAAILALADALESSDG